MPPRTHRLAREAARMAMARDLCLSNRLKGLTVDFHEPGFVGKIFL